MVGDTTFDMNMARAAGVTALGVSWGYHAATLLGSRVIDQFDQLPAALADIWGFELA
jgi:phosphoglycolate phosphatase